MTQEDGIATHKVVAAHLPTDCGDFELTLFHGKDGQEHLVMHLGDLGGPEPVLIRLHSECFTGDVFGSRRCDCGQQLKESLRRIAKRGRGAVLYLRQEGRGIGLAEKLKCYCLQDLGYDTVDANLALGHEVDCRDYGIAAEMLEDLGISRICLLTNNPAKVAGLEAQGICVDRRVPLIIPVNRDNEFYMHTKATRMGHDLHPDECALPSAIGCDRNEENGSKTIHLGTQNNDVVTAELVRSTVRDQRTTTGVAGLARELQSTRPPPDRPNVTLSYAQSLDGCTSMLRDRPVALSGQQSLTTTHLLRSTHDAVLLGIGTVLADDPQLTVRFVKGRNPMAVIVDSRLRFPLDARLLGNTKRRVLIATTEAASFERIKRLEKLGANVVVLPSTPCGHVNLEALLYSLRQSGIESVMVEGGGRIISQFLRAQIVDRMVVTIAPQILGGVHAVELLSSDLGCASLRHPQYAKVGADLLAWGAVTWTEQRMPVVHSNPAALALRQTHESAHQGKSSALF